jgi:hypothetical protein
MDLVKAGERRSKSVHTAPTGSVLYGCSVDRRGAREQDSSERALGSDLIIAVIKHIRGLAPSLPADVVGFSSRIEKDEEGRRVPKRASVLPCAPAHSGPKARRAHTRASD